MGPELHTPRLDLVLMDAEEARALAGGVSENGHPWAAGYPLGSSLLRAELTLAAAARKLALRGFGSYQMIRRADGHVIGDVGFMGPPDATGAVSVGCGIIDDARGQGYATEAVGEILRLCFDVLGLRRVTALCFADNIPSWRLMERLGMRREEHNVRDSLHRSGEWLDGYGYALLAEDWRGRA